MSAGQIVTMVISVLFVLTACSQQTQVTESTPPESQTKVAGNQTAASVGEGRREPQDFSRWRSSGGEGNVPLSLDNDYAVYRVDDDGNIITRIYPPQQDSEPQTSTIEVGSNLPIDDPITTGQEKTPEVALAQIKSVARKALSENSTQENDVVDQTSQVSVEVRDDLGEVNREADTNDQSLAAAPELPSAGIGHPNSTAEMTDTSDVQIAELTMSDEQDFEAVSQRESIESDALRRSRQRATRVDFTPQDIPERKGAANVAEYALASINIVGNKIYRRDMTSENKTTLVERCSALGSAYAAQQTFLDAGGPEIDELHIDPDGDGFACNWTPEIYRSLVN